MPGDDALTAFGEYLRTQRRLAKLTLRELSELTVLFDGQFVMMATQ